MINKILLSFLVSLYKGVEDTDAILTVLLFLNICTHFCEVK